MRTIIECVPNVSEGRDRAAIDAMASAVRSAPGVRLLDVSSDGSHNRSVLTFVGDAPAVKAAVLALFREAVARIDLRAHRGEHPRMGAVDVVPFIPVQGSSVEECVALSRDVGEAIASGSACRSTSTKSRRPRSTAATSPRCGRASSKDSPRR